MQSFVRLIVFVFLLIPLAAMGQADTERPAIPVTHAHNYSYLSLGYINADVDELDEDFHGLGIGLSYAFNDWFHLWGGTSISWLTVDEVTIETTAASIGPGIHGVVNDGMSAYARIGYMAAKTDLEVDYGQDVGAWELEDEVDGYSLGAGLRFMLTSKLQGGAGIQYGKIDSESETTFGFDLAYAVYREVTVGASITKSNEATGMALGFVFFFE